MKNRRHLGIAALVVGFAILIVSAGADVIGLGKAATAFGFKQIAGCVAGAFVAVVGAFLILQRPTQ